MEFGASIFFTDYSISPAELAVALEERGFDSLWAAEHSHIPVPRRTPAPGGGELAKRYYDVMDPFVTLTAGRYQVPRSALPRSPSPPQPYGGRERVRDRTSTSTFAKRFDGSADSLRANGKR